ncbi:MAG: penicillin-binding protein activator [Nitrospinaceae bacterium]
MNLRPTPVCRGRLKGRVLAVGLMILFAVNPGEAADRGNPPRTSVDLFQQAEYQYRSDHLIEAKLFYQMYFEQQPEGRFAERALFRLGQIDQRSGSCSTALKFYEMFLSEYPRSPMREDVRIDMGECYFELGRYDESEKNFRQVMKYHPNMKMRWQALYDLARLEERRQDYPAALVKLKKVYEQDTNQEAKNFAVQLTERIIGEKLERQAVISLINQFVTGFPVDRLLFKLVSIYRWERDLENYQSALLELIRRFPGHAQKPEIEKLLKQVEKNPGRILKLGVVLPLTGKLAVTGQQVLQGIQLAVHQMDLPEGHKLELIVEDSAAGRPVDQVVEELATNPNVVGILGPVLSDEIREIVPIVEKYQVPVFTPTASAQGLPELSPWIFRNALTREIQARFLARYSINKLHVRRVAILYPLETFGIEMRDAFAKEFESLGGEVVTSVAYERSQTDFKPQILELGGVADDQLKKLTREYFLGEQDNVGFGQEGVLSRPAVDMGLWNNGDIEDLKASLELSYDAIFIPGFYDKVSLIVPQLVFYNIDRVTLLGGNGWNSPELLKTVGKYIQTGFLVDGFFAGSPDPEVRKFVKMFKNNFGKEPTIHAAQAYDSARMVIGLILKGADNRKKIQKRLYTIHGFQGVSGTTTILPSGDSEKKLFALKIKGRKFVQAN